MVDSSTRSSCWQACNKPNLEKNSLFSPPSSIAKRSSGLGRGHWSTSRTWLDMTALSSQMENSPFFGIGIIGETHDCAQLNSSLLSSSSMLGQIMKGTGCTLKNHRRAPGHTCRDASYCRLFSNSSFLAWTWNSSASLSSDVSATYLVFAFVSAFLPAANKRRWCSPSSCSK